MKRLPCAFLFVVCAAFGQIRMLPLPSQSPLITFRVVVTTGAAYDPVDKPGLASLTAALLAEGGTKDLTYKQILDAMFPMATSISSETDKEMTTFSGTVHRDNLEVFYKLFRSMLLDPGWRDDDFKRLREDAINFLKVSLRGNNDEELGKEVLYNHVYDGTPYRQHNVGTISALQKITLDDLKGFYRKHYTQSNVIVGIAGDFSAEFQQQMQKDFQKWPKERAPEPKSAEPKPIEKNRAVIVEKDTRSVAWSFGFPIKVRRGDPDYVPLLVAQSYFGQHRMSGGRLYQRMRELRGLNYGDYAYIEYFPRGMFQFEPNPNLARKQQIFQVWIRPVEPQNAVFSLRLAVYELDKLVREGLSDDAFQRSREFLSKYVNLLMKTKRAELGYRIDSLYYDIPEYGQYIKKSLEVATRESVNRAIQKHLRAERLQIVAIAKNAQALKSQLAASESSPVAYNAPKPEEIVQEDRMVAKWDLRLRPEDIQVIPLEKVFE